MNWKPEEEGDIYCKRRIDIAPYTYERATIINGKVAHSEVVCLGATWKDNIDPYANDWQGHSVDDLKTAGFQEHDYVLQNWLCDWARQF